MKKLFFTFLLFGFIASSFAQSFEGIIDFRKTTGAEKVYYSYTVKGNKVRIDEKTEDGKTLIATLLVDLNSKEILALSHDRKLFMKREAKTTERVAGSPKIVRSGNHRFIQGYDCEQWRVKNETENTEISYWVTKGNYDFFLPLLGVLGRKDRFATYYLSIPDREGYFPVDAVERDVQRNEKGRLEVLQIAEKKLDDNLFVVPKTYMQMEN
ncbi:MAG: DUF4412 domain-containing protein [Bacteroidia bacterium]